MSQTKGRRRRPDATCILRPDVPKPGSPPGSCLGASLRRSNWTTGAVDSGKRAETFYNQFSFSSCEDVEVRGGQQEKGK